MENPITRDELQKLLSGDEETALAALDFYFEYVSTGPFVGQYQLKNEIEIIGDNTIAFGEEHEAGHIGKLLMNDANRIARRKRDELFNNRLLSQPQRKILVTEGDSWFQYPKYKKLLITLSKEVKDIVDYIIDDKDYNVKSLDAAGDLLRNMFHSGEYIDAIGQYQTKAFLLSGGGNDFFEVFSDMLQPGTPGQLATFLKPNWITEIKVIETYYKAILDRLTTNFPELHILLHGYDYPMPSHDGKWIGRPMIEKGGLNVARDRSDLIKIVMNKYNNTILNLTTQYQKVHFMDLRGTVPQDPNFWHDEIHPNDQGFSLIANKFINVLNAI